MYPINKLGQIFFNDSNETFINYYFSEFIQQETTIGTHNFRNRDLTVTRINNAELPSKEHNVYERDRSDKKDGCVFTAIHKNIGNEQIKLLMIIIKMKESFDNRK